MGAGVAPGAPRWAPIAPSYRAGEGPSSSPRSWGWKSLPSRSLAKSSRHRGCATALVAALYPRRAQSATKYDSATSRRAPRVPCDPRPAGIPHPRTMVVGGEVRRRVGAVARLVALYVCAVQLGRDVVT